MVYWDRDVAPTLDWEPRFVERVGVLWAQWSLDGIQLCRLFERAQDACRCLVWDGERWVSHRAWHLMLLAKQLTGPSWSTDPTWERQVLGRWAQPQYVWMEPATYKRLADRITHAPHRWRTIRQVLGRNQPR